mmetsp:Transcript_32366/g.70835  ORF Transcript_32366/g.70835 Transcript_32366/m.70835 type:complete len:90 (-) Transcript_32366:36-305(-)
MARLFFVPFNNFGNVKPFVSGVALGAFHQTKTPKVVFRLVLIPGEFANCDNHLADLGKVMGPSRAPTSHCFCFQILVAFRLVDSPSVVL